MQELTDAIQHFHGGIIRDNKVDVSKFLQRYGYYYVTTVVPLKNHFTMTVLRVLKAGATIKMIAWNVDICVIEKIFTKRNCRSCNTHFQLACQSEFFFEGCKKI